MMGVDGVVVGLSIRVLLTISRPLMASSSAEPCLIWVVLELSFWSGRSPTEYRLVGELLPLGV